MQKLFSTQEVHPRDRFDLWQQAVCKHTVDQDFRPQSRRHFHGEIKAGSLADCQLLLFENSPMEFSRTQRHIANARHEDLFFCSQIAGSASLEQCDRSATLGAGHMLLVDPAMPFKGSSALGSKALIIKVPRRSLEARVGHVRELTAIALKSDAAEHTLTSSFLRMLPAHVEKIGSEAQGTVAQQALDLIALCLARAAQRHARLSSCAAFLLFKIRSAIEARLTDPNLNVAAVATAAGVSVRYANSLLAQENTSLRRLIQSRRLTRCFSALEDPSQARRTVSEIAYSWGFSDMTHFGRAFKKAYGMLPSECQRRAIARKSGD